MSFLLLLRCNILFFAFNSEMRFDGRQNKFLLKELYMAHSFSVADKFSYC